MTRFLAASNNKSQQGIIMVLVLITGLALALVGLSLVNLSVRQFSSTSNEVFSANAEQVAEAGIEQSLDQLNSNADFAGYASPQVFFNSQKQGYGVFTAAVTNGTSQNEKVITAIGKVYRNQSASSPVSTRTVRVTVVGTSSSGYSVYTGPGGLILTGSASIVNSSVYANGYIKLTGASSIGSQNQPLDVDVANDQCPPGGGSTYPQVCTDGTQPITMDYSTHIYGTVCATGQTSTGPHNNITGGNGGGGLNPASCPNPVPQVSEPTYDRDAQIAAVTTTASSSNSAYTCSGVKKVTWPANLELTGNVSIGGSCTLTITGNVYITGNLTVGGAAKIVVADSVGSTRPVIITDGTIDVGGSGSINENSSGTGAEFISFKSTASCSPDCTSLTGTDLYNSQQLETINVDGATDLPGIIFDAYWSKLVVGGSGTIGAAIGQTVQLSGAGTVTFGTTLSSGERTWTIRSYQQLYQ